MQPLSSAEGPPAHLGSRCFLAAALRIAAHGSTLQRIAAHCGALRRIGAHCCALRRIPAHCGAFPRFAAHCRELWRIDAHYGALPRIVAHGGTLWHGATQCRNRDNQMCSSIAKLQNVTLLSSSSLSCPKPCIYFYYPKVQNLYTNSTAPKMPLL